MKLKLITLSFSILLILLLVNACKKRRDEPQPKATILYGKVVNEKTGDPIKGAKMSFQDHEYFTPNSGEYHFQEMAGEYPLIVEHKDYDDSIFNVVLRSNKELIQDTPLKPIRSIVHATHQDDLHFESTTDTLIIEIENAGIEESLVWEAESNRAWLIISPTQGTISGEGSMSLEITIDIDQLTVEKDTGKVTITNGIYKDQNIQVSVCAEKDNIETLSEGLIAYYPFNNNTNDESVNELHAEIKNISETEFASGYGSTNGLRISGNSGSIDSSGGHVEIPFIDFHDLASNQDGFTISFWVKEEVMHNSHGEAYFYVGGNNDESPYEQSYIQIGHFDGDLRFDIFNNQGNQQNIYKEVYRESDRTNSWHMYSLTYDTNTGIAKAYINSELKGSVSTSVDPIFYQRVFLGRHDWNVDQEPPVGGGIGHSTRLTAVFDDVRFYNRALTDEEVILLYNE